MTEAYIIAVWLMLSLLAGSAVYEWSGNRKEAVFIFWVWPIKVFIALVVIILVSIAWAYLRINYWIGRGNYA